MTACRSWASRHLFSVDSGWCVHGCGVRDDGLVLSLLSGAPIHRSTEYVDPTEPRYPSHLTLNRRRPQ